MGKAIKLTTEEFIKKVSTLKLGEGTDFAIGCAYLDKDLDKANEDDLTDWYGVKKISEFDQEIILIGGYGGDDSYAISYSNSGATNAYFEYELQVALDEMITHNHEFTGIYVFKED